MTSIGYALSSEEHMPNDLVHYARLAEEAGFPYALISDHFHPWVDQQGQSPFVWSVIGGISQVTEKLRLGTGVTASIMRIHPAIIAQAAATAAAMMPGRFFLGVGSGENLNEHILGDHWPPIEVRLEMLEEYVEFIRLLWEGENVSRWGTYYTVENARIYTLPEDLPPIMVAAGGKLAGDVAGRIGDGLIATSPDRDTAESFREAGGHGKPMYGQLTVCWGEDEAEARRTAHKWWPNTVLPGFLSADLIAPPHFELAVKLVSEDDVAEKIICGPVKQRHLDGLQEFIDAGFDYVYIHQVGPDQEGFLRFYQKEILPEFP
jgi:coenzyme F420-dependent glucose-6-phosphate dehydrogenase